MTFEPENIASFELIFRKSAPVIRGFKGCRHLELYRDIADSAAFVTYSIWDSEADLEAYRYSDFFRETWSATRKLFASPPLAWSLEKDDVAL